MSLTNATMEDPVILFAGQYKVAILTFAGPASYTTGGFTITINQLRYIAFAGAISALGNGWVFAVKSWSGNTVTIQAFGLPSTLAAGPLAEAAAGTNLSGANFTLIVIGN
jgi:hypothetical protein